MEKKFRPALNRACDYLTILGLKLNHVSKRGSSSLTHKRERDWTENGCYESGFCSYIFKSGTQFEQILLS